MGGGRTLAVLLALLPGQADADASGSSSERLGRAVRAILRRWA